MLYKAWSDRILNRLSDRTDINMEYRAIYSYALEKYISGIVNTLVFLFVVILFRIPFEAIVFFIFYAPLRRVAGGRHAKSRGRCMLLSVIFLITTIEFSVFLSGRADWQLFTPILLAVAIVLVFLFAPVDCENKRFSEKIKIKNRKIARGIILADSMIILFTTVYISSMKCYIVIATMALLLEGILLIPNLKRGGCK